ncbi:hypothetical protein F511_14887 [Dorcoceras hygrometricum]|uniref:Uncharacterized protein n=1 Tax=Dorcoceras hygrometricum TaxID=472368 RepID=A0A2Z7C404_9LAMI|nr:hypothetical protein F511_14887 [Dorcoceras hygrometricum]
MRYGSTRSTSIASWYAQNNKQGMATTDLSSRDKCVYATDAVINTETYTLCKAYTAASIITHAQSKAVKQAHIRTSSLLCYNYYNGVPSNIDFTPAKPNTDNNSGTVTQKPRIGSYKLNPILSYPSNTTEGSKKAQASSKRPRTVLVEASKQEESSATTLTSIGAVYHRYVLSPKQIPTNSHDVAEVHYRNRTRHPLLKSESLAQEESETQNGVALYTLRSLSNLKTNAAHN